jgi:protein TonB
MQPKKSEKVDLTKNSSLYFVIGLAVVLFVSWQAIEWKTYKKMYDYEALNVEDEDDEEIPITRLISPKSSHRRGGLAPRCRLVTS